MDNHPPHHLTYSISSDSFLIYKNLSSKFKRPRSLPKEVKSLYTLIENFPTKRKFYKYSDDITPRRPCSPRAQPFWKMTRVRDRESPGHLSDLASSSQQLVGPVN